MYNMAATTMTGSEFKELMKNLGYTQIALAHRWGVVRQTIARLCQADWVDPVYADALMGIVMERSFAGASSLLPKSLKVRLLGA
jgi:predicted transcriptional regulator